MTYSISGLLRIDGQVIHSVKLDTHSQSIDVFCRRDRRFSVKTPNSPQRSTVNTYLTRIIHDLPISGLECRVHIELAQTRNTDGVRLIEESEFVEKGVRYSKRFCHQISVIAKHFGLRWETVKNIDKALLNRTLPPSDPALLTGLTHIGVDEVARAKGHDYMTVVYDMNTGRLIWVEHGRTNDTLSRFLTQLSRATAQTKILGAFMPRSQLARRRLRSIYFPINLIS